MTGWQIGATAALLLWGLIAINKTIVRLVAELERIREEAQSIRKDVAALRWRGTGMTADGKELLSTLDD